MYFYKTENSMHVGIIGNSITDTILLKAVGKLVRTNNRELSNCTYLCYFQL